MSSPLQNLVGRKYNRLTVLEHGGWRQFKRGRESTWKCRCDCGKELTVPQRYLVTDGTKSCGCIIGKHKRTHGGTGTPEFRIWDGMRRRCSDPKHRSFESYGGRGISVCARWKNDFAAFLADMGPRPSSRHSIDRYPNNDGNYEPGNCRWATPRQQSNNRRSNRTLTINDETKTLAQWDYAAGLKAGTVSVRLSQGWEDAAVLLPPMDRGGTRTHPGRISRLKSRSTQT